MDSFIDRIMPLHLAEAHVMTVAKDKAVSVHKYYSYSKGKRENEFFKVASPCSFGGGLLIRDLDASQ